MPPPARPNGCSIQRSTKTASAFPPNLGWLHRGVAYWRNGDDERIVILTAFAQMIALDAKTGKPVPAFGKDGRVDLTEGLRRPVDRNYYTMTSPPVIVRGVIVVGSSVFDWWGKRPSPPGDVRGFDIVTGRLLWTFHTVAQGEEPGVETWEKDSWKEAGNANVWAPMSADEELGYVYLPVSTPTNDYYGGHRPGDGLYGESLVCLDVDDRQEGLALPARPSRPVGLRSAGRAKPDRHHGRRESRSRRSRRSRNRLLSTCSIASPANRCGRSRSGRCRPPACPASAPRRPSRFRPSPRRSTSRARRDEDLIDLTPEIHKEAIDIAAAYDRGGLYTPPSQRGTIRCPAKPAAPIGRGRRSIRKPACSMSGR